MFKKIISIAMVCTMLASFVPNVTALENAVVYGFEKKETEERMEKQRVQKREQEEQQYNLKIDGKDVADLIVKMVELVGASTSTGVTENGVSAFDVLA